MNAPLYGKKDIAGMINLRTVRWRDYSKLSRWNYIITTVLIRENQGESPRVVLKGVEGVVMTEAEIRSSALKMK